MDINDFSIDRSLNQWAELINEWAQSKGWNEDLNSTPDSIGKQLTNFHSEISEAWEEIKNNNGISKFHYSTDKWGVEKPEGFSIELADLIIRVLHTCGFYGINIEEAIQMKMNYNLTRPYRHGGKSA